MRRKSKAASFGCGGHKEKILLYKRKAKAKSAKAKQKVEEGEKTEKDNTNNEHAPVKPGNSVPFFSGLRFSGLFKGKRKGLPLLPECKVNDTDAV